ncbi:hypothetical protein ACFL5V_03075 [Fibrobacterota bacterium]
MIISWSNIFGLDLFISGGYGWTHYEAEDLNKFMVLLERQTNEGGFNPYQVQQFDGHWMQAWSLGVIKKPWKLAVEAEFWIESFKQSEVAFDSGSGGREERLTCAHLADPAYQAGGPYGCIEAEEEFVFLPLMLQLSYNKGFFNRLFMDAGYGIGIMAGYAGISISTDYYGGSGMDDKVEFGIDPGVNLLHKFFLDFELRPLSWLGIQTRSGYRISKLNGFTLVDKKGDSQLFNRMFNNPEEGDELYFESYGNTSLSEEIVIGKKTDAGRATTLHRIEGDFTGWFVNARVNFYWRGL